MNEGVTFICLLTRVLPTWVEQSKDTYIHGQLPLYPTSFIRALSYFFSFFVIHFLFFFHCPHIFIFVFTVRTGYLYVTDTLSTPTITEPLSVVCQDLLTLCQMECMWDQNYRLRFIVPSERQSKLRTIDGSSIK